MASSNSDSSPPSLEELSVRGAAALLSPLILAMGPPREVAVFVHQPTGSVTIIEGSLDIESLLQEIQVEQGPLPATKASIEALPRVRVSDPGLECSICLMEYEVNGEAEVKKMPCNHQFHAGCIDKWLGLHGSCPVCRFSMPVEDNKERYESGGFGINLFIFTGPDSGGDAGTGHYEDQGMEDGHDDAAEPMGLDSID
ncbi:E3 ubiquitin-protein ligase rnf115 [Phtheirospermum japonicum]|uniref:RING-type E3 ubiquitin transferase n=1 Tax=Phtheirospermum japonicum TaxID=374723 RepID=A0A830D1T8_9LAMI|nr:E3 ubiquitin-protein ligase rnf115 [Phtheirospermum japonicum]